MEYRPIGVTIVEDTTRSCQPLGHTAEPETAYACGDSERKLYCRSQQSTLRKQESEEANSPAKLAWSDRAPCLTAKAMIQSRISMRLIRWQSPSRQKTPRRLVMHHTQPPTRAASKGSIVDASTSGFDGTFSISRFSRSAVTTPSGRFEL
jgi:hypothetical protein